MNINKRALAITLLASFLVWRVLSLGMADHFARDEPERALFWRSEHPEALFRAAQLKVQAKQWAEAKVLGQKALRANPLDGRCLRILAQVAEAQGNEMQALVLFQKAVELAPRDLVSHAWLMENALRQKQAEPAVRHLDAILRIKPSLLPALQAQGNVLAVNAATQPFLITVLKRNPSWRAQFLSDLANAKFPSDTIAPVFNKLVSQAGLLPNEYLPWLSRLRQEKRYTQAYLTWVNLASKSNRKYLGNVFDGGFELPFDDQGGDFTWQSKPVPGAFAQQLSAQGVIGDNAYMVEFDGRRTAFANLTQLMVLPPGTWQLNYRAKANRLDSTRGIIWRISCESDGRVLLETEPMRGQFDWRELKQNFTIPTECSGQRLTLLIPARIPAETQINGSLWLDEVRIQAVDGKL